MTIGGHQAQLFALGHEQDAVEVIADVMHRHRKRHLVQQVLERLLGHAEGRTETGGLLHHRKILGRHRLHREPALASLEDELVLARFEHHGLIRRHGAQDVDQLARTDGGREVAGITLELGRGADLDFQVAGGDLQRAASLADQHIGKDGQCVPTFHDTCHRLKDRQYSGLRCFHDDHVNLFFNFSNLDW